MGGSDKRLVKRATRGDESAFEEIYRRYGPDLYRFCLAMTSNPQDAQDALQNTMVKVLRALPGEERQIVLKPWLYRIARNEAVDVLRKRRDNEELGGQVTAVSTVAETAEVREHLRMLLADLEQLPQRQRAVLLMRELSGLDFAEIAVAFGTSAGAIRQTLYEARLSLQQLQEGRERRCADVQKELSDADGRVIRRRKTRAHLRSCRDCLAFYNEITNRQEGLAAIAPLPAALSISLLRDLLGGQAGGVGGGIAGGAGSGAAGAGIGATAGGGAGNALVVAAVTKSATTLAVAALAVSAVDRGGLVDLPLPGKHSGAHASRSGAETTTTTAGDPAGRAGDPGAPEGQSSARADANRPGGARVLTESFPAGPVADAAEQATSRSTAMDRHEAEGHPGGANHPEGPPGSTDESPRSEPVIAEHDPPPAPSGPEASEEGQETAAAGKPPGAGAPAAPPSAPAPPAGQPEVSPGKPGSGPGEQAAPAGKAAAQADPPAVSPPAEPPASPGKSGERGPAASPAQPKSSGKP